MLSDRFRQGIENYVTQRRCRDGGFCFYRLEEPNGSDTYYALSILSLLGFEVKDEKTVAYLKDRQRTDGSYESTFQAYFCISALQLFNEVPAVDPSDYILSHLGIYDVNNLPAGGSSIFGRLFLLMELCCALKLPLPDDRSESLVSFVLQYQQEDKGFGHSYASLIETMQAVKILALLGYTLSTLRVEDFEPHCEDPVFGYVNVPRTSTAFLEHIHAGIELARLLSLKPRFADRCWEFVLNCQNRTRGFSRTTHGGIATLENTWLAVKTIYLLREVEACM